MPGPDGIHLGLRAYVRHAAHLYEHAPDHFELMTVADVLAPLLLYLKLHPEPGGERLAARLLASLPGFHSPDLHYIGNRYPPAPRDTLCDLWYCFENGLIKYAWIALASGNSALAAIVLDGMRGASVLAERTNFCFPLFADFGAAGGPTPTGSASNYSVAGLYAFGALLAAELSGDPRERDAARHALAALRPLPAELMYHEPQQLAFGAAAAAILARDGDQEMATLADRLAHAQVRMVYWHEDPYALAQGYRVRGLFQACASLLDPAFKEEVEAILPWVVLLRDGLGPTELLLKLLNLGRQHSFAFFEPCLPGRAGHSACPFIPYENLGTTELPETGTIGKEIYGAGEVFWLYLLFEALARTNDPTICTIFLDLLEPATLASFPPLQRRFMLYNPTAEARDFEVQFSHLAPGGYTLVTRPEGIFLPAEPTALASGVPLRLEAHRWQEIELIPEGS
ncbi:MAG: hypothetical protein M5U01_33260 [Ardenticatenaceae bacterium]|nr:hypothetical protein [Ardenticatenaceae bacterium]